MTAFSFHFVCFSRIPYSLWCGAIVTHQTSWLESTGDSSTMIAQDAAVCISVAIFSDVWVFSWAAQQYWHLSKSASLIL